MTKKLATLLLSIALGTAPATAQQPAPAPTAPAMANVNPALWVVKDNDTTIYLFGTVHVLKPGLSWFDEAVKKAFDKSDQLVLELVMPDPTAMQALITRMGVNQDPTTLTNKLPAADRPAYTKALTDLGIPPASFDHVDPWLAATELSILPLVKLGYTPTNGPEAVLSEAAKAAGKPIVGLETAEQQLGYLDTLPEAAQIAFLESTVKDVPKAEQQFDQMVLDWSKGDPDALAKIMNDDLDGQPQLRKTLLTDRNARWAEWIVNRMKTPGTVFIAVGAGHLAGQDSVIDDLTTRHVAVTRVSY